jgi:hypothetical protein
VTGTGIAVAFARSPMVVAQAAWPLADASGGRFILRLGSQVQAHIERRYSMPWHKPIEQMRDCQTRERPLAFVGLPRRSQAFERSSGCCDRRIDVGHHRSGDGCQRPAGARVDDCRTSTRRRHRRTRR